MTNLPADLRRLLFEGWLSDDPHRRVDLDPDTVERLATDVAYALLGLLLATGAIAQDEERETVDRITRDRAAAGYPRRQH